MPTGIWRSRWRSGCAHWDLGLRRRRMRRRRRRRTALIKSNNPHLAGGKNQLMLFGPRLGCLFGPRMGYGACKWVLSRTMFQPRMLHGSPERRVSTSRHARSQCMSESQGRSIRGFDRWDFTNEHAEVS